MKNLGKIGIDKISGFRGMITAKINYLYGADEYKLTPTELSNGAIGTELWFPVNRIKISNDSDERPIGFSNPIDTEDWEDDEELPGN